MREPAMSVVMVDMNGDARPSLDALRMQGPPDLLEVLLVAPDPEATANAYPDLGDFGRGEIIACPPSPTTSAAIAAGLRAATCPIVAYCEDHAFPQPGWAQTRIAAHTAGAAVVGGALSNANPDTATSWASFLQSFGPFAMPVAGGSSADLPWHQCSYRRDVLPLGPGLEPLLECEALLHTELRRAGHRLELEPAATARHLNPSRFRSAMVHAWLGGRAWGAGRSRHERWSAARRVRHALLAPREAAVQLRRRLADVRRVSPDRRRRVSILLALGIAVHAAAEAVGVLLGDGGAVRQRADFELNRRLHLTEADRRLAQPNHDLAPRIA